MSERRCSISSVQVSMSTSAHCTVAPVLSIITRADAGAVVEAVTT